MREVLGVTDHSGVVLRSVWKTYGATVALRDLTLTAAAVAFAVVLAGGLAAAMIVRPPAVMGKVEESPPVRRN